MYSTWSRYLVVLKKGGGVCPILDLRVLNKYLQTYRLKKLTLRQLLSAISHWFATIDLTDAYFHVALHPDHRQFLSFVFMGMAYGYLVLPFSLSIAPHTFTKCVEAALAPLCERGVRVLPYLDDLGSDSDFQRTNSGAAITSSVIHSSTGLFGKSKEKFADPESAVFFPRVGIICSLSRACLSECRVAAFSRCLAQFQLGCKLRFRTSSRERGLDKANSPHQPHGAFSEFWL